nr:monothiol glutaredoxin-S3 [Ipomoea batatas]
MDRVSRMAAERPVVMFSKSSCCMSHSIRSLFNDMGVNPAVYELDVIPRGREIEQALSRLGCNPTVPAVFIGGELVGGENEIMSLHLQQALKPKLKRAGALWVALDGWMDDAS